SKLVSYAHFLSSFLLDEEGGIHLGEAILVGGRMGSVEQKIYKWKQYQAVGTNTYYWNRYNAVSTTTYKWNKWNAITTYRWNRYSSYTSVHDWRSSLESYNSKEEFVYIISKDTTYKEWTTDSYGKYIGRIAYSDAGVGHWVVNETYDSSQSKYLTRRLQIQRLTYSESEGADKAYGHYYYKATSAVAYSPSGTPTVVTSSSNNTYPSDGVNGSYYYQSISSTYSKGSTSYGQVTSTSSSAYPSNGASGSYWYESAGSNTSYSKGSTQYSDISSTDRSAYPDNNYSGSYWYVYSTYTTTWSQGDYIGDRLSTDRDRWPDNGRDGDYWYVFDGEA
ncbi:hypothetical protein, partial [uncultured Duncaniella sp.]|uniref:hypothetical protein n=1 Tax=uncultured Duncaniella sp. TaxID=2768039 RepID=UPI002629CAAD